jgi:hypothetical protein
MLMAFNDSKIDIRSGHWALVKEYVAHANNLARFTHDVKCMMHTHGENR